MLLLEPRMNKRVASRTGRPRDEHDPNRAGPFGNFIWEAITSFERDSGRDMHLDTIAEQAGLDRSNFHGIVKGRKGRAPIRPEIPTIKAIVTAMQELDIPIDVEGAYRAAEALPKGLKIVPDDDEGGQVTQANREIGARIRDLREHLRRNGKPHLTQQYLGQKLGMDGSNFSKVEAGTVPLTAGSLRIVADELETTVAGLYGEMSTEEVNRYDLVKAYNGLPPRAQDLARKQIEDLKAMFADWDEDDNAGTVGKRS